MATTRMVTGAINFITPQPQGCLEKPYQLKYEAPDGFPPTNIVSDEHMQRLADVRGREAQFSVPRNGFTIIKLEDQLSYEEYDNEDLVRKVYFKQVAEAVQELLGASRVQIFEHVASTLGPGSRTVIDSDSCENETQVSQSQRGSRIDVTPSWAAGLAEHMNELKGIELPSGDLQFVNIWKPLRGPIKDWPLAVCDASTVSKDDLRESDIVFSDRVVENLLVQHNPKQEWYFISDQTPSEAWVFLQADSNASGHLGVPHSSFQRPDSANEGIPRESIEVRAIAYYNNGAIDAGN
ncbi:uncharacterized protein LTR77_004228 [Saxophila tyrrhenica]|uniref:Uncharacterized protein n=1 Tax=Saxophila tyrrhenica TaxID=1690608 RepID=A0AAV9PEN9_9PEZI|nr:hypothetical protein LTR77_004228 [Saxophila tyrrhenica]